MSYLMNTADIKTGDIMLVAGDTELSETIEIFEKCGYSHAAVCMWDDGILYLVEALEHGIALTNMQNYLNSDEKLLIVKPCFDIDADAAEKFLMKFPGNYPYGYLNLLFLQPIKYLLHIWLGEDNVKNPKRFICGQFAAYVLNYFNKNYFKNWVEVAPVDIYNQTDFTHIALKY